MHKAGRYTAALLLISVGAAVAVDKFTGMQITPRLVEWWPVLFILLGLEYIFYNMKLGASDHPLKLDIGGLIFSVLISAAVVVSTQSGDLVKKIGDINFSGTLDSLSEGTPFEKETLLIPAASTVDTIRVDNPVGDVVIVSGSGNELQIDTTVYVHLPDEEAARRVADESVLEHRMNGSVLELKTAGKSYESSMFSDRVAQMDLVITVPEQLRSNYELKLKNGGIEVGNVSLREWVQAETTNGRIQAAELKGELRLKTVNGHITASSTEGKLKLDTSNGRIEVEEHQGDAELKSTNGEITSAGVTGVQDLETTNGSVTASEAQGVLKARTTNGSIEVDSSVVGGDWDLKTSHGKIEIEVPENGDYRVEGKGGHGSMDTDLPLQNNGELLSGTIGAGKYMLRLATQGSISVTAH